VLPAVLLVVAGAIGIASGVSAPADFGPNQTGAMPASPPGSMAIRFGILMLMVGVWLLTTLVRVRARRVDSESPYRSQPVDPGGRDEAPIQLLLAALLIAVGTLGLAVGSTSPTLTEIGLEIVMVGAGIGIFTGDLRQVRRTEAEKTRAV
jgi:hypothetical protein